jgi:hypothetical protein
MHHHGNGRVLERVSAPQRNNYFYGKLLDVPHFQMEQNYFNRQRWLLNRLALGKGVLSGLEVKVSQDRKQLYITPGAAIDGAGKEIMVPGEYFFDPWKLTDDCGRVTETLSPHEEHEIVISICYRECFADYAPVLVTDCNVQEQCAPGTIIESFFVQVEQGTPEPVTPNSALCEEWPKKAAGVKPRDFNVTEFMGFGAERIAVSGNSKRVVFVQKDQNRVRLQINDVETNKSIQSLTTTLAPPIGDVAASPASGFVFVTHNDGIVSIDLQSSQPFVKPLVNGQRYGACVAAHDGKTLFAVNLSNQTIERIDLVPSQVITSLLTVAGPCELALSSDDRWLYVLDIVNTKLIQINLSMGAPKIVDPFISDASGSMSVRSNTPQTFVYLADTNRIRRIDESGVIKEFQIIATPADSAFTSDGQFYYILSQPAGNKPSELIVFESETMREIVRRNSGFGSRTLAIVPNGLRAYIANTGSFSIADAIVEEPDWRRGLCEVLSGPDTQVGDPCVTLATVRLLPNGTIGDIDTCTNRPIVLSNAELLDVVLCLLDRIEECCARQPSPTPSPTPPPVTVTPAPTIPPITVPPTNTPPPVTTPPPTIPHTTTPPPATTAPPTVPPTRPPVTPPPTTEPPPTVPPTTAPPRLMHVERVAILLASTNFVKMTDPHQFLVVPPGEVTLEIVVRFGPGLLDYTSVKDGSTFIVEHNGNVLAGEITNRPNNTVSWHRPDSIPFLQGDYIVRLIGNPAPEAIQTQQGMRLDGEPAQLPSGDGMEGGDFVFTLLIQ